MPISSRKNHVIPMDLYRHAHKHNRYKSQRRDNNNTSILSTPNCRVALTPVSELDINWGIVCESGAFADMRHFK